MFQGMCVAVLKNEEIIRFQSLDQSAVAVTRVNKAADQGKLPDLNASQAD